MILTFNKENTINFNEMINVLRKGYYLISYHVWDKDNADYLRHPGIILPYEFQISSSPYRRELLAIEPEPITSNAILYPGLSNAIAIRFFDCAVNKFNQTTVALMLFIFGFPMVQITFLKQN